jgi:hypothetical protein
MTNERHSGKLVALVVLFRIAKLCDNGEEELIEIMTFAQSGTTWTEPKGGGHITKAGKASIFQDTLSCGLLTKQVAKSVVSIIRPLSRTIISRPK